MRIYKEEKKSREIFKKYKYIFSLKKIYFFSLILIMGGIFFTPLGLLRSDKYYVRKR